MNSELHTLQPTSAWEHHVESWETTLGSTSDSWGKGALNSYQFCVSSHVKFWITVARTTADMLRELRPRLLSMGCVLMFTPSAGSDWLRCYYWRVWFRLYTRFVKDTFGCNLLGWLWCARAQPWENLPFGALYIVNLGIYWMGILAFLIWGNKLRLFQRRTAHFDLGIVDKWKYAEIDFLFYWQMYIPIRGPSDTRECQENPQVSLDFLLVKNPTPK